MQLNSPRAHLSSRARALRVQEGRVHVDGAGRKWGEEDAHSIRSRSSGRSKAETVLSRQIEAKHDFDDRRFLLEGFAAKKRTRTRKFIQRWRPRYLWLSEDLQHIRWCKDDTKNLQQSDDGLSFVEIANLGNIESIDDSKLRLYLIDSPKTDLCFDVGVHHADRWKDCLERLCHGDLSYRLLWNERDAETKISIHWRAADDWFPGTISGWNNEKEEHEIIFDDGKVHCYDLTAVFFRVDQLPEARRQHGKKEPEKEALVDQKTKANGSSNLSNSCGEEKVSTMSFEDNDKILTSKSSVVTTTHTTTTKTTTTTTTAVSDTLPMAVALVEPLPTEQKQTPILLPVALVEPLPTEQKQAPILLPQHNTIAGGLESNESKEELICIDSASTTAAKVAAAAIATAAAIAAETAAQTEVRKTKVHAQLKAMLLGDFHKWTYTLAPGKSMKITEDKDVPVKQGEQEGTLAVGLNGDNDTSQIVVYSNSDQVFTMDQALTVGSTAIVPSKVFDLNFVTLSNKIRFQPNTTEVFDECKHVCSKVAHLLNMNPDIRIRVDGHVRMKKKYRNDPDMMGQAERLSALRAKSVVKELKKLGVGVERMEHKGFGGNRPLPKGQDDKRVEISVLGINQ